MIRFRINSSEKRDGIALIMVVGLLALMMILGVAFAMYMRTGRLAAGSFKNGVVVRQFLPVALNRALIALNQNLGDDPYPRWYYLASGASNGTAITGVNNVNVMAWIPQAALGPQPASPKWMDISTNVEGRVGYLVVNCSGLLDANFAGGSSRGIGTNVNEIQILRCKEVADVAALVAGRPYETIQEFGEMGQASGALAAGKSVENFVCYSASPTGYPGGINIPLVDISGDENALTNRRADIVNGLIASGIPGDQADFVYTNLLDYVDKDNIPRDFGSACTEAVPMFDEILVTNTYRFGANTNFSMIGRVYFEWFYPFLKTSLSSSYWIESIVSFDRVDPTPLSFPLPAAVTNTIDSTYSPGATLPGSPPSITVTIPSTNYAAYLGASVVLKAKVQLRMHANNDTGPLVDVVPYPTNLTVDLLLRPVPVPSVPSAVNFSVFSDAECADPRFNWDPAQWLAKQNSGGTLGKTNTATLRSLSILDTDGYAGMFVADRPLTSVTELTYLLRGGQYPTYQWSTIHLLDWVSPAGVSHPIDRVLDHFTIRTNSPLKGFVNPNSSITNILTAVFEGLPLNNYPDEQTDKELTLPQAEALSEFWADTNRNPWRCNFVNLSDIGHVTNIFGEAVFAGLTPFQQESFFRNTAGLFNTRQQYFKILLFAQTTKSLLLKGSVITLDDVCAIAEVWRDPLPNANGIHPCIVRMVQVINND